MSKKIDWLPQQAFSSLIESKGKGRFFLHPRRSFIGIGIAICAQLLIAPVGLSQTGSGTGSPVKLYGRIEQLSTQNGAQLPVNLSRQPGRADQSSSTQLPGHAEVITVTPSSPIKPQAQFPDAFLGSWEGTLKIHSNQFSSLAFEVDRDETMKEEEFLKPGKAGDVVFTFSRAAGQLILEPSRIVFSVPMSQSRLASELAQQSGASPLLGQEIAGILQSVPYYYGLEMGNVQQGIGITGNALQNQVVKNDIKQLGVGIVEQDLVCYNQETNPRSRRVQNGYSEMVLRFYQQTPEELYVQVASVNYLADGRFKDKILLYGTVRRASDTTSQPTPLQMQSIPPSFQDIIKEMTNPNLHP